jgi:hypothetical protein
MTQSRANGRAFIGNRLQQHVYVAVNFKPLGQLPFTRAKKAPRGFGRRAWCEEAGWRDRGRDNVLNRAVSGRYLTPLVRRVTDRGWTAGWVTMGCPSRIAARVLPCEPSQASAGMAPTSNGAGVSSAAAIATAKVIFIM